MDNWVSFHIVISVVTFGALALAVIQGALLSLQDRAIRRGRWPGMLGHFPALSTMETWFFRLVALSFLLLSLLLLSGFWLVPKPYTLPVWQKTIFGVLAWGVLAVLLLGRMLLGWRGATAVRLAEAGMALLIVAYVGARFLPTYLT